jgi:hypothetical protein
MTNIQALQISQSALTWVIHELSQIQTTDPAHREHLEEKQEALKVLTSIIETESLANK